MSRSTMRTVASFAVCLFLSLIVTSCSDDKSTGPTTGGPPEGFPSTPDQVLANFRAAYEAMDAAELLKTLRADHITILEGSTTTQFPDVGSTLDMTEETRIHERMFSKQDVVDPVGTLVPGIRSIVFQTFTRQGEWSTSVPTDAIPNTPSALYDVKVLFDRGPTSSILLVLGQIRFYVSTRDSTVNGETRPYCQLRAQMDMTQNLEKMSDSESSAWGTVKALFR